VKRQAVSTEIRQRVAAALCIDAKIITVHWTADDRPSVRIPVRLHTVDADWPVVDGIVSAVLASYEPEPLRELSDTDYAARMRAKRGKKK